MNLFLPEDNIVDSIIALDDLRLKKQILECEQMITVSLGFSFGYAKHPVIEYYSKYPYFIARYGTLACIEYQYRMGKKMPQHDFFYRLFEFLDAKKDPKPFYCEGFKTDPNCIRTTENTVELFRNKLSKKWDNDKYEPKWTNREKPKWYTMHRG